MSPPAVLVDGLSIGWGGRAVLENVDLRLDEGSIAALIGTNGSGKTTLLSTLGGLIPPISGACSVLGGAPGSQPTRVAYLRQFHARDFILPLRARDIVAMGRYPRAGLFRRLRKADRRAIDGAIERMGIGDLASRALGELSGGQRQRVYLAQTLAWEADVILLDEPSAGLDPSGRGLLARAIREELDRGVTVITATHDVGEALRADWVMVLASRVVSSGPPKQALKRESLMEAFGLGVLASPEGDMVALDPGHGHGEHDAPARGDLHSH